MNSRQLEFISILGSSDRSAVRSLRMLAPKIGVLGADANSNTFLSSLIRTLVDFPDKTRYVCDLVDKNVFLLSYFLTFLLECEDMSAIKQLLRKFPDTVTHDDLCDQILMQFHFVKSYVDKKQWNILSTVYPVVCTYTDMIETNHTANYDFDDDYEEDANLAVYYGYRFDRNNGECGYDLDHA